jgi:tripartite-type tricarboxylate transporter receptor subunit TctC
MRKQHCTIAMLLVAGIAGAAGYAAAQTYPTRPVMIVVRSRPAAATT